jgi:hypothetical protein
MGDFETDALTKNTLTDIDNTVLNLLQFITKLKKDLSESKNITAYERKQLTLEKYFATINQTEKRTKQIPKLIPEIEPEFGISKITTPSPELPKEEPEEEKSPLQQIAEGAAAVGTFALAGKYASDLYIGPTGDLDGQQTGLDMNLPGGIGAPIYAPIDMIYRVNGTDGNPSVGLDGTADVMGGSGRGFGYYGSYFFVKDGRTYEVLMGHLASMGYRGTADNQPIPKGTILGYQGASGRTVGAGGQPYPHISLHINGVGFTASNSILVWFANLLANPKASTTQINPDSKQKPLPQKISSINSRPIIALMNQNNQVNSAIPNTSKTSQTSSLNTNYTSFDEILLAHTTFNVG